MYDGHILFLDTDPNLVAQVTDVLTTVDFSITSSIETPEIITWLTGNKPDMIILNPRILNETGYQICADILNDEVLKEIPLVLVLDEKFQKDLLQNVNLKVADVVCKPFNPKTFLGRITFNLIKTKRIQDLEALTNLPGKVYLKEDLEYKTADSQKFDTIFFDLKAFRIFNKYYGFERGNQVIKMVFRIIREELALWPIDFAEIFHLGGDRFAILMDLGYSEDLAQNIIKRFDEEILNYYDEYELAYEGFVITNRQGHAKKWPIMTMNIGIVSNENRNLNNWLEVESVGDELLKYSKSMAGSRFVRDRRRS